MALARNIDLPSGGAKLGYHRLRASAVSEIVYELRVSLGEVRGYKADVAGSTRETSYTRDESALGNAVLHGD